MIKISSLSRHYGEFKAVDDVSFEIQRGEVVGLLGHNGAGKTTIMKMMTGFLEPTGGSIQIDGLEIGQHTRKIQQRIGYLPENCPVWPEMTVIDYLLYQAELHGVPGAEQQTAVARAIRRTALKEKARATIQTLSRGYRQRVGVAQAILHDPDIIILVDELQAGQRLLLVLDNNDATGYLRGIEGVGGVEHAADNAGHAAYLLDTPVDNAPVVAAAVQSAGDRLYGLQPEVRNLETVFAEVNHQTIAQPITTQEAA